MRRGREGTSLQGDRPRRSGSPWSPRRREGTSRHVEGARVPFGEPGTLIRQRREGPSSPRPRGPSHSRGVFLIALPCGALPAPHGPGRGTAGGAGEVARDAQLRQWSALHRGGGAAPAAEEDPGYSSSPLPGSVGSCGERGGGGWEPTALGRPGGEEATHLLVSGAGPCGAQAAGWRGTAPRRPGPAVPAPSARAREAGGRGHVGGHSARRARSAGRIRARVGPRAGRLRAAGARPEGRSSRALRGALTRAARPPPPLLAPTSPFHPVRPRFSSIPQ